MGRRKIDIEYIKDDRSRATTFVKRKTGLFKKAYELGILTGTQIAVIVFNQQDKLFTYSSDPVEQICARLLENPSSAEAKFPHHFGAGMDEEDGSDEDDVAGSQPGSARKGSISMPSSSIRTSRTPSLSRPAETPQAQARNVLRSPERRPLDLRSTPQAPTQYASSNLQSPMLPSPSSATDHASPNTQSRDTTPEGGRASRKRQRSASTGNSRSNSHATRHTHEMDSNEPQHINQNAHSNPSRSDALSKSRHPSTNQHTTPAADSAPAQTVTSSKPVVLPSMQHYPNPLPQYHTQRSHSVSSQHSNINRTSPRLPAEQQETEPELPLPSSAPGQQVSELQRPTALRSGPMGPPLIIPNQYHGANNGSDAREGSRLSATHLTQAPPMLLHPAGSGGSAGGPLSRALHPGDMTPVESPGGFASALFGNGSSGLNGIGSNVNVPRIATDVGTLFYNWDKNEPGLSPATSFALNQMAPPAENLRAAEQRSANNTTPTNNGSANREDSGYAGSGERPPISAGVLENFSPTTRTWLRQHAFPAPAPGPNGK